MGKEINVSEYCKGICIADDKSKMHIEGEFSSLMFWQHGITFAIIVLFFFIINNYSTIGMEPDDQQIENNLAWFEIAKDLHST